MKHEQNHYLNPLALKHIQLLAISFAMHDDYYFEIIRF